MPDVLTFSREDSSFQYLERPGKTKGTLHGKIEGFLLVNVTSISAKNKHNFNGSPTFSTMADLTMTTSTSPDVGDDRLTMAATKPELEITFEM